MKKKITTTHKPINKTKNNEQKQLSNNILINTDFFIIFKKFYESSSKYIQSMRTCLKEVNINIVNNKSIPLDESSNKCISSLNIIFSYLDSSFSQFYSSIHKYFDQANSIKYLKISNSNKKPNLSKNISSYFYNDNNYKPNSIYNNYQFNKVDKNNLYKNKKIYKVNTTTEMKKTDKYNSIMEEKMGHFRTGSELNNKSNNNIFEDNNKTFIESVKNLINVLKYEKINDVGNPRKTQYQQKLSKFKENLISELSNSLNDNNNINATHRRIRSVNLNSNTFNSINNINENEINKNQIDELIIQENDEKHLNDLNDEIYKNINDRNKTAQNKESLYFFDKNEKVDISENIENNIIDRINLNNDYIIQKENKKLKNENETLEKNKKELLIQIADLINNNNSLNEEISILKNSNIKKTENDNKSKGIINELNKKIESIINEKNEMEKNNQILKKSIDKYENNNTTQLKEIKQLKNELEELKIENKNLNNKLNNIEEENKLNIKTITDLKLEIDDLNKEIGELVKDNEKMNNEIEDKNNIKEKYNEKYEKAVKELNDEKQINSILEKKIKNLETKLDEHNINEYDETKTKTYKLSNINKVNEIEVEQLPRKYVSPYNYRKNTSALSTNNTSNNRKIIINNNLDDLEISPDNYIIVKTFQLNNNLKWYLLKKKKKNVEHDPSPTPSPNQSNSKHIFRRFKYLKTNSKLNNEKNESFSDFIWKPNKNEKDFINFNYLNNENDNNKNDNNKNDNNKNDNSNSKDWQKKINELEYCIKDLEEKLEKKENDCNRINLNYAKLVKRSKQPELNYDKVLENNEKLKSENRILKKKIDNLKLSQNFIALSFIADDLEGSRFIDDNCFEELLDGLAGGPKKNNTYKRTKEDNNLEINMLKFFRSHADDNENKEINEENNNIKKDLNDINDNNKQRTVKAKEKRIHLLYINEENDKNENNIQIDDKNYNKDYNKLRTFKRQNKKYYENNYENTNKNDNNKDNNEDKNNIKNNEIQLSDNKNNSHKKYLSYRYSRYRHYVDNNKNDANNVKNDLIEKNEKKDNHETVMNNNLFKNDYGYKKQNIIEKTNNDDQINKENKLYINKLTDAMLNKKSENENENVKITNHIYKDTRGIVQKYKKNKIINNEKDFNKDKDLEEKKNENIPIKNEEKKENKPYRSLKSMKINSENKIDKVLQESSSQTNRVCRGRRFYKRKQEDINNEIKE